MSQSSSSCRLDPIFSCLLSIFFPVSFPYLAFSLGRGNARRGLEEDLLDEDEDDDGDEEVLTKEVRCHRRFSELEGQRHHNNDPQSSGAHT